MFDGLSGKLQDVFKKLRGQAILSESNITEAMREIRLALLDADVNYEIVKEFVGSVEKECMGHEVLRSITPGQQVIKVVNDKLVELMGTSEAKLDNPKSPSAIMMVGLHGSGKTTTAAKLAAHLKKQRKRVMLVAGDVYRPAAIDQLEFLGKQIDVPVHSNRLQPQVDLIAKEAIEKAKFEGIDVVIIDTAGRLQVDTDMVHELVMVSQTVMSTEILLVADSALGQEAVSVADHFHKALGLTGVILTKLDGDARGGAALSIRKVTGCPIKFVGVGEKIEDLEVFHPDRMASRILGMGDVVSLVEKASEEIDAEEAERLEKKIKSNKFDLNDFYSQLRQMKKLGGVEKILKMLPGGKALSGANLDTKQFTALESMICSMTKKEKSNPEIIDFSRKKRIAVGAGVKLQQISDLLKKFFMMKKVIRKPSLMSNAMGSMGMGMPPGMGASGMGSSGVRGSNFTKKKKKRKKK
jgi:signal recognition particle subunit SRP54